MFIPHLREVQDALLAWHREHGMHAPWRESGDPYETMVAAVMAQQTQMSRVIASYERFIASFPTVEALASASAGDVIRTWAGMGYNSRAIRLHRAAKTIVEHGWPHDAASLATIDGIGPFTAAIIASFAFAEAAACVDTNVRRVLGRLSGDEGAEGKRLQTLAGAYLAASEPARWNQAVMDYGARVCVARPRCGECVIAGWCASRDRYAAAPLAMVADERAAYEASPAQAAAPPARRVRATTRDAPFERSTRYYRGRIIDALRALPRGGTIAITTLPSLIATAPLLADDQVREFVAALQRDGLVALAGDRICLPD